MGSGSPPVTSVPGNSLRPRPQPGTCRRRPASNPGSVTESFGKQIEQAVTSWPGVTVSPHRFGGIEFRVGRRELGHLHGDRLADLPFPVRVREQLVAAGKAERHHVLPESGWVTIRLRRREDVAIAIELFRLNYDRV